MNDEISRLIALQDFDTELAGFDREAERIREDLAAREQAAKDRAAQAGQCRERAAELEQSREAIRAAGEEAAERIKERQVKMMQVQTSREHQALLKEIEDAKKQIRDTEEQMLQAEEDAEAELKRAAELEQLCKGELKLLAEAAKKAEEAVRQIEARRAEVAVSRSQLAKDLPEAQLKRYEKLLVKRKGLAVVRVVAGVCQGCFMTVPPQHFNLVRKGGEVCSCPACQRILYYKPDPNQPEQTQPLRPQIEDMDEAEDDDDELNE
uniref:zinc ribbon domain-containing protein n=1 Tax=Candidatus Electronema sp. TaxID=2698783 RepID=UPI0040562D43